MTQSKYHVVIKSVLYFLFIFFEKVVARIETERFATQNIPNQLVEKGACWRCQFNLLAVDKGALNALVPQRSAYEVRVLPWSVWHRSVPARSMNGQSCPGGYVAELLLTHFTPLETTAPV